MEFVIKTERAIASRTILSCMTTFASLPATQTANSEDAQHQMTADVKKGLGRARRNGTNVNRFAIKSASIVFVLVQIFVTVLMDMKLAT